MLSANGFERIVIIYALIALLLSFFIAIKYVCSIIKDKSNRRENLLRTAVVLALLVAGYICLVIYKHYCVDSFAIYWDMAPFHSATEGRYIKTAVAIFCMRTGLNQITYQQYMFALWIPVTTLSVLMISDSIKKSLSVTIAVSVFVVNTFVMELLLFPEVALENTFTNLLLGATVYVALSDVKRIIRWPLTAILMFMTSTGYQCYMPVVVIWVIAGAGIKYKDDAVKKYIEAVYAVAAGIAVWGINFAFMKLFNALGAVDAADSVGEMSIDTIICNIKGVIKVQFQIWNNAEGTYRIPFLMAAFGVVLLVIAVLSLKVLETKEARVYYLLAVCGTYILAFAVHFIENPQEITPRSIMPVWSIIASMLVTGIALSDCAAKEAAYLGRISVITTVAFLCINLFHMNDMSINVLRINETDISEAKVIAEKIHEYEDETGETLTTVVMRSDGNLTYYHENSKYKVYQLGARIMATDFSRYHCIGYFLGHDLENEFMSDEDLERLGHKNDWNAFNPYEQVFIENGKAYIIVY